MGVRRSALDLPLVTLVASLALLGWGRAAAAQSPGTLTALPGTFVVDSGVRTRGLPFTVGDAAGIRWRTPAPVAANATMHRGGPTLERHGQATVRVSERASLPVQLTPYGSQAGLQSVTLRLETTAHVAKLPGKTASGLWAMWQCPQAGCELFLTILYRRADVAKVECISSG